MESVQANCLKEWSWSTTREYADPFNEVDVDVVFTDPQDEERRVPAFWSGDGTWRVRYASPLVGTHHYRTVCSDKTNRDLDGLQGSIEVTPYEGDNPLLKHGPLRVAADRRHLEHADGTAFFWLGDTWWMALCSRLKWPEDFETLTLDRQAKGFSVIQIVAGFMGMPSDERSHNEAGFCWNKGYRQINPAYFDLAERRIDRLVQAGLVPCILPAWGSMLAFTGMEPMKKLWRYLVARYSAYPVVWCLAGEATNLGRLNKWPGKKRTSAEAKEMLRKGWTEMARYLRSVDGQHHPITIHPGRWGHKEVEDPSVLDFLMYQAGHGGWMDLLYSLDGVKTMFQPPNGGWTVLSRSVDLVEEGLAVEPKMPALIAEVNYEGAVGSCGDDVQRFHFWSCILSGAAGHTYGANGIWQVSTREKPYGSSGTAGLSWEGEPWEVAYQLPGSRQLGLGKRLLERYPWWQFETHPEWVEPHESKENRLLAYAAGVPGKVRVVFIPGHLGMLLFKGCVSIEKLEADLEYRGFYFNPRTGEEHEMGVVRGDDEGRYILPGPPLLQDWVVVLER